MFGIAIDAPANILNDNISVVKNSSNLESTLNKKHSLVAYHLVRWNIVAEVIKVGWIKTLLNLADALRKRLLVIQRDKLLGDWTY